VHALPEDTQSVLRAAAVIGRPALVPLLAATTGTSLEQTETLLRPAIDQHVVEIRRDDTIAFRHPAFGEVVYAELMPTERQRLHRAAAEALEPVDGLGTGQRSSAAADAVSGELARHWYGAGDKSGRWTPPWRPAGRPSGCTRSPTRTPNFTRALDLMDDVPGSPQDRVRLLKHAGQAASLVGDSPEAVRLVESALALASDPSARAAMLTRLGLIHYRAGRGALTERCLREALTPAASGRGERPRRSHPRRAGPLRRGMVATRRRRGVVPPRPGGRPRGGRPPRGGAAAQRLRAGRRRARGHRLSRRPAAPGPGHRP
jgi:hypothetical protein